MKKSKPSTIGDDHAVVNVLTNTSLWLSIAQFQTGLPLHFHPIVHDIRVVAASMWDPHRLLGPQTFQEQSSIKYHAWFAEYGLHAVRVLQQKCMRDFVVYTSFIGHISSLATLLPTSLKFSMTSVDLTRVWKFAARNGHLPVIQYLHMHQFPGCTSHVMDTAAGNGHLDIVSFLHSFRGEGCTKEAMDAASFKGFLDVVQFLHRHRKEGCTKSAMTWAARLDQLQVVRFLDENRTEGCTKKALDWAAKHGHLNVVKYLHEHRQEGCPEKALLEAAKAGHMHIVRYLALHAKDLHAWMHRAMQTAVAAGHLKHVRALVEQGGRCAASNDMGHVVEAALETAMDTGHTAIAHYLLVCYSQLTVLK
ncbi:hypothetical protein DYB26_011358 [Aphanomyces astaci]|uniref:Uncharacterized protein n=2 Tax=Aphanomyces astaci TaxID=112090 RepID=A0A418FXP2_APHAT|nr:hypothetical protein DYB26_011358 [Aphanomyces astaci]